MAITKATMKGCGISPNNLMVKYFMSDKQTSGSKPRSYPRNGNASPINSVFRGSGSSVGSGVEAENDIVHEEVDAGDLPEEKGKAPLEAEVDPVTPEVVAARKKRKSRSYEHRRTFQPQWAALHPWAEIAMIDVDGVVTQVHCNICSKIEGREKLYVSKIDGLWKHAGRKRAEKDMIVKGKKIKAGGFYFGGKTQHEKNERLLLKRPQDPVHRQLIASVSLERKQKLVQFTLLFTLLTLGRPMSDYEHMSAMFRQLRVPDSPTTHWSITSGWGMAESIFEIIRAKTRQTCFEARFISISADEVTCIDNTRWLSIHVYVMKNWERIPFLLSLQKISDAATAENIEAAIMEAFLGDCGNLSWLEVAEKIISFGADGAAVFQGCKSAVIARLQAAHTPFMIGMHCCAHRTNLAVEKLDKLPIVVKVETLCQSLYTYFAHSPKRTSEFQKLAGELETEGRKIQRNVKSRWISLLGPMESVLREYKTLVVQMSRASTESTVAKANANLLLDLETFIALPCLLPLLRSVDELIRMAQSREVMIQDFIGAMKLCQCDLHASYIDLQTSFRASKFSTFQEVVHGQSYAVSHKWKPDLETHREYLSFKLGDHSYATHWIDEILESQSAVTRDAFDHIVYQVKKQCREAAQKLITELEEWFPNVDLLNAFGIVHPQYWVRDDAEEMFRYHMLIIEENLCQYREVTGGGLSGEESKEIKSPLDFKLLQEQQPFFKLTMIGNSEKVLVEQEHKPDVFNPMTRLWRRFGANALIRLKMGEWLKLAEIAIVTVMGSVEDERVFLNLSFIKSKLRNRLQGHLDCLIRMFTQQFYTLQDFPFQEAITHWLEQERRGLTS